MLMADCADHLVVGGVVATQQRDSDWGNRVSFLRVDEVLFGPATVGDTLAIAWRTRRGDLGDGWGSITSEPGPQLSGLAGPHVWLLVDVDEDLSSSWSPLFLSRASRETIEKYLEWARAPRRPYAGTMSDPEKARARGYDPERGDVVRAALAAYLAGYLEALDDEQ
jgi:hypothetical protein